MYTHKRRVSYSEISSDGFADCAKIADYFQDCSSFQSEVLGVGMDYLKEKGSAWLLASWQIVIDRYPVFDESLNVSTWPYGFDAVFGYRNFKIEDEAGNRIAVANSQWIYVDTKTGHPVKLTEAITKDYVMEEKADMFYASRKIPFKDIAEVCGTVDVQRAYIDTNQHMNNAWYIRLVLNYVPADFKIHQVRTEFKKAAILGDRLYIYVHKTERMLKYILGDAERKPYAVVELTSKDENGDKND